MPINEYLKKVKKLYDSGISTEHSYRGDLQVLISSLVKGISVTNEPKRQKCGAPDYIIQKKEIPLGYIEAKDIAVDLDKVEKSNQMQRYLGSLDNLILTDYLEFRFYKYGQKLKTIKIASVENGKIKVQSENLSSFETHITDFCGFKGQTIKSAEKLAQMMAQKARMMEEVLFNAVKDEDDDNSLIDQLSAFRQILIHDLDEKTFSDIYAQTIAYGLFGARLHDSTLDTFSRQEARDLIPRSNPFLRNLFDYVSGAQLDSRVVWIVDDLCEIFRATDLTAILADFGKSTAQEDPYIHFYETFLAVYDQKLRKSRGVYYTPEPVVKFIVRAVDDILKTEFGLSKGLADTSKTTIKREIDGAKKVRGKAPQEEIEVHKVQILDPATGTGTFLAETIRIIYSNFKGQEGLWSSYVEEHLLPRMNGFEILMASYTMCHLKLEMLLRQSGYKPKDENKPKRLKVFLTNSLEEAHPDTGTLFASWLSKEATDANIVKLNTPVMCVIGNPPYANFGQMNQGSWIKGLIEEYKKNLNEKKINLDDDYIKFIRYGQYFIDRNGEGILAYISNNSFLNGVTHRQMRKSLMNSFNDIYILNLHGNSNIRETSPDGSIDNNVFDIKQGVSINIFIKRKSKKQSVVHYFDLFGKREDKYSFLLNNYLKSVEWVELKTDEPYYFFENKDLSKSDSYNNGFEIKDLFVVSNSGIKTDRDGLFIDYDKVVLSKRIQALLSNEYDKAFIEEFNVRNSGSYKLLEVIKSKIFSQDYICPIQYRPFDNRWIYYDTQIISRPAEKAMKHLIHKNNLSLSLKRQSKHEFSYVFIHRSICESCLFESAYANNTEFPLYLYNQNDILNENEAYTRQANFNPALLAEIENKIGLKFVQEKDYKESTFSPIDLLDYIYAILHSPMYRTKYSEQLKYDFPKIPFPNSRTFQELIKLGSELRAIHLFESDTLNNFITTYPIDGTNSVDNISFSKNKVCINDSQYFNNVPETAWSFYIGGYQPAQKWLKDRKGRVLSTDEIMHYQMIIVALTETEKIMNKIDDVGVE